MNLKHVQMNEENGTMSHSREDLVWTSVDIEEEDSIIGPNSWIPSFRWMRFNDVESESDMTPPEFCEARYANAILALSVKICSSCQQEVSVAKKYWIEHSYWANYAYIPTFPRSSR